MVEKDANGDEYLFEEPTIYELDSTEEVQEGLENMRMARELLKDTLKSFWEFRIHPDERVVLNAMQEDLDFMVSQIEEKIDGEMDAVVAYDDFYYDRARVEKSD